MTMSATKLHENFMLNLWLSDQTQKVKLSLCLTEYLTMNTHSLYN